MRQELANQRAAISTAIGAARTAVNAVNDESTDEQVQAAEDAIADARVVVAEQDAVPDAEKSANNDTLGEIMANLNTAKESRMAAIEAAEKAAEEAAMARAATGRALYAALDGPEAGGTTDALANNRSDHQSWPRQGSRSMLVPVRGRSPMPLLTPPAEEPQGWRFRWGVGLLERHRTMPIPQGSVRRSSAMTPVVYTNRGPGKNCPIRRKGKCHRARDIQRDDNIKGYVHVTQAEHCRFRCRRSRGVVMADDFTHSGTAEPHV